MTSLPSQHPTLSLHLTDVTLTPLITSSSSPSHLESLTSLTSSALTSQTAVQRANLGRPQRIMVEYPDRGAVVLHSYLDPREHAAAAPATATATRGTTPSASSRDDAGSETDVPRTGALSTATGTAPATKLADEDSAPLLVGVVVAGSADDAREARRAAARLERVGREFQREWAAEAAERSADDVPE